MKKSEKSIDESVRLGMEWPIYIRNECVVKIVKKRASIQRYGMESI